jgi:hypothetical protein
MTTSFAGAGEELHPLAQIRMAMSNTINDQTTLSLDSINHPSEVSLHYTKRHAVWL